MKTNAIYLFIGIILTVLLNTCSENPIQPKQEDNVPPGRRDYTWTEDTLKTGELLNITKIWGTSPQDLWAIGIGSWSAIEIWHYDGLNWSCDSIYRDINPWSIFGFSSDEVWLGNSNSTIWKYDGKEWNLFGEYKIEGYSNVTINYFAGDSRDDLYGMGFADISANMNYEAILMHFDGFDWKYVDIPETKVCFAHGVIINQCLLISGYSFNTKGYRAGLYLWDGSVLQEIYSGNTPGITKIAEDIYVTIDQKIYRYMNKKLTLWIDKTGSEFTGKIWGGKSANDFFWCSEFGIGHYNGTDFKTIYEYDYTLVGGIVFKEEVFFITKDWNRTGHNIIIHGKLK